MTANDYRSAGDLHDEEIVEALLAETRMNHPADTDLLQPALMNVRNIAHGPQPTPQGELADLLAALNAGTIPDTESDDVSSLEAHRTKRRARHILAATVLSLTVGAGAAAAAASPDFRGAVQKTVTSLVTTLTSAPDHPSPETPTPVRSSAPAGAVPGQPVPPGTAVPGGPPATPPAASDPQRDGNTPDNQTSPGLNSSPATGHPAPLAPVRPQPVVPAQPAPPSSGTASSHQTRTVTPIPAPAPAPGSQTPRPTGRP